VISRLSQLQEDVDKLRSLSDTLSSNYDKTTAEVCLTDTRTLVKPVRLACAL